MGPEPIDPHLTDEAAALIQALIDGDPSPAEVARLDELVRAYPSVCRMYLWQMQLHSALPRHVAPVDLIQRATDLGSAMILPALTEADVPSVDEWHERPRLRIPTTPARHAGHPVARWAAIILLPVGLAVGIYIGRRSHPLPDVARVPTPPVPAPLTTNATQPDRPVPSVPVAPPPILVARPPAIYVAAVRADWETSPAPAMGQPLPTGELVLRSGLVRLKTDFGASVVVQGPARFRLASPAQLDLATGTLTAVVPEQARGFTVQTPTGRAVDLGTEFGVSVSSGEPTHVEVFRGVVQAGALASTRPAAVRTLTRDEAVEIGGADGAPRTAPRERQSFVRSDEFEVRRRADDGTAFGRWLEYSYALRHDPALVLYYPCEAIAAAADDNTAAPATLDSVLPNRAMVDAGQHDLALLADSPRWGVGRWPRKRALAFDSARNDRLVVNPYPVTTNGTLTVAAWVNAASRPTWASIAKCRGDELQGQFALCLYGSAGDLMARVFQEGGGDVEIRQGADKPLPVGRWVFTALVVDGRRATLYRDGEPVASVACKPIPSNPAIRSLGIGYRTADDGHSMSKRAMKENWNGSIDELALFHRPLSADEIRKMYEAGRPD